MKSFVHQKTRLRRAARLSLLLSAALLVLGVPGPANADDVEPETVVNRFDATLLEVMRDAKQNSFHARFDVLAAAMDATFDFQGMTAMALGNSWSSLAVEDRATVVNAFRRFSVASYVAAFDSYSGERSVVVGRTSAAQGIIVTADLVRTDNQRVRFGYLLHQVGGTWRVVDIYLNGTISQLAVRRSEFASVLAQGGADGLVGRLLQKVKSFESAANEGATKEG